MNEFTTKYNEWKSNQLTGHNIAQLTETIVQFETVKSDLITQIDKLYQKELSQFKKYTEILEFTDKSVNQGLDILADAIETEPYGKVSKVGIVNYDLSDKTKPLIIKVYADKWVTFPVPLIIIFNGLKETNSLEIVTTIQLFCGHENSDWTITFEDD